MNDLPPNPSSQPLDEGDLLALVEGMPLPPERAARVREAMASDPRLAELAALLRSDRDALASTPLATAPTDLLDRVEARLERDALVGLAQTEATSASGELPVSVVLPARRVWLTRRTAAPLAAAAAVALIAGGVLMLIPGKKPAAPGPIAVKDAPTDVTPIVIAHADKPDDTPLTTHTDTGHQGPEIAVKTDPPEVEPKPAPPQLTIVAKAEPAYSTEQLLAAAREGKLVLRLRTPSDAAAEGRVKALAGNTRSLHVESMRDSLAAKATQAYAGAWSPRKPVIDPPLPRPSLPEQPIAGANTDPKKPVEPPAVAEKSPPAPAQPVDPAPTMSSHAFMAAVPATGDGLEALRKALSSESVPADWQILPDAITLGEATDAASVLWWTAPATAWTGRFSVPIVVQTN